MLPLNKAKWKKKKLSALANLEKGEQINGDLLTPKGLYPVINGGMEPSGYHSQYNRNAGTITISEGGNSCGYVNYMKTPFWSGGHCYTLSNIQGIDTKFLYHVLKFKEHQIMKFRVGSGLPNIQRKDIENLHITYIGTNEGQMDLANILSTCDEVIEKTEETIEKYKQIKEGMMQDLFTRGLDKNGKLRPSYTQAPDLYKYFNVLDRYIPREWEVDKLENLFTYTVGGDIDWACFSKYKTLVHRFPIFTNAIDEDGLYGYSSRYVIDRAAITITGRGNIGIACYRDAFFTPIIRLVVAFPKESLDIFFASMALTRIKFESEATGVPQLTVPMIKKYKMSFPANKKEQERIFTILNSINKKIKSEEQYLNKYKQIKQGLLKQLLTPPANAEIIEE